jgi:hypothetical protein
MPTRSPGDAPEGTIATLGLPTRAVTALTRAGITDVAALAALSRRELAAVPGLGAGLVTAIRRVVPEPPATLPRAAAPAGDPAPAPATDDEGPAAPEIPSFASLRDPRRRTALDLLVPAGPGHDPGPGPRAEEGTGTGTGTEPVTAAPPAGRRPAATAPRPAEYADLLGFAARLVRAAVTVPGRVALWSVQAQVDLVRRLLGG